MFHHRKAPVHGMEPDAAKYANMIITTTTATAQPVATTRTHRETPAIMQNPAHTTHPAQKCVAFFLGMPQYCFFGGSWFHHHPHCGEKFFHEAANKLSIYPPGLPGKIQPGNTGAGRGAILGCRDRLPYLPGHIA